MSAVFNPQRAQALREQRGLTREQFAVKIDRAYGTVVKIDRGEIRPSLLTLGAMANALCCSVSAFFDGDHEVDLVAYDDDPTPTEDGAEVDSWVRTAAAAMPRMSPETARRVSAVLFPATPRRHKKAS